MSPAPGSRESGKSARRAEILEAAKAVFLEKGYDATSISDIIRRTSIARGTFYLYFRDKQEIFDSLLRELFMVIAARVAAFQFETAVHQGDFRRQMVRIAGEVIQLFEEHSDLVRMIMLCPYGKDTDFDRQVESFYSILIELSRTMIQSGIDSGHLNEHDANLSAYLISGALREFLFQRLVKGRYTGDISKTVEAISDMFLFGLYKQKSS